MSKSIGIFDSGVGGLTVLREVRSHLPKADLVYLGDTARVPYGTRSRETVTRYAMEDAAFLEKQGVDYIIIACHTASAFAFHDLQSSFKIPVIGVVEPAVKKAVDITKDKAIGIIGTDGTVNSGTYQESVKNLNPNAKVISTACPLFVPLAEEGWLSDDITLAVARRYLDPIKNDISSLILGCTHYPLLKKTIQSAVGEGVTLIDSAEVIAEEIQNKFGNVEGSGTLRLCATDVPQRFTEIAERFLGGPIPKVEKVQI